MVPPPRSNENQRKEDETNNRDDDPKSSSSSSSSSWFGSWFERDTRNAIHEQLNAFEERKQQYEEEQKERQRFFEQHASSSSSSFPFQFFFPPENSNYTNNEFHNGGNIRVEQHKDDSEDIFGERFPRPRWQGGFVDGDDAERRRRRSPFKSDDRGNSNSNSNNQREEPRIDDIHQEMQNLFEAAFAGGMMPPPASQSGQRGSGSSNQGWMSSSSTTVVSNSNGVSYTIKQDSRNGARVDLKLPRNCESENMFLEVLDDRPCRIRWRDNNHRERVSSSNISKHRVNTNMNQHYKGQVLELGESIDCSRLSASISEAKHTLTVKAPPKGKPSSASTGGEEEPPLLSLKQTNNNSYPRPVRITKKQ